MALPRHVVAAARALRAQAELAGRGPNGRLRPGHRLGRRRPIPKQQQPKHVESDYARALIETLGVVRRELLPMLEELPKLLDSARQARGDSADPSPEHREVAGIPIVIENPAGSVRRWVDSDGTAGETVMRWDYGEIENALGADGEGVDVYVGPVAELQWVFIVAQMSKASGFTEYDEDKVMLGWLSADAARDAYIAQYDDPRFFGGMTVLSLEDFKARLQPAPGEEVADVGQITIEAREDSGESLRIRQLIERARKAVGGALNSRALEQLARRYANATTSFQAAQFGKQLKAALGVDIATLDRHVPAMVEHFVGENSSLITSLANRTMDDIEKMVTRAFTSGSRADSIASDIEDRFGVQERHARLIARDQIGKLNGQVNAARQRELGIDAFYWRSSEDERVRPEHAALDGRRFLYSDPPAEGLPGEPVLCRCQADPDFSKMLDEVDGEA